MEKSSKKKKYYKSIANLPSIPDCVYVAVSNDLTIQLMKDYNNIFIILVQEDSI